MKKLDKKHNPATNGNPGGALQVWPDLGNRIHPAKSKRFTV